MTSADDVANAIAAGVDAVGLILATSPRRLERERFAEIARCVPPFIATVAVFADNDAADIAFARELGATLQFSGHETPATCEDAARGARYLKAHHFAGAAGPPDAAELARYPNALWLFDSTVGGALGGTGVTFEWANVRELARDRPIVLSGGLTPENVAEAVRTVRPYAVDVRSGVETGGRKDEKKMQAFVRAVRESDAEA